MKQPKRFVVITRPVGDSKEFVRQLEKMGMAVFSYPTIRISKNLSSKSWEPFFRDFSFYDWIIFTSKNGVYHFMNALNELGIGTAALKAKYIAVVGPTTEIEVKKYQLQVHFMPSRFTTDDLARELPDISGKRILLPRSNIASSRLTRQLKARGADVVNMAIYKTEYVRDYNREFDRLLGNNQILCITFTSPSTVEGFVQSLKKSRNKEKAFSVPILSIGSVTTRAAKKQRFGTIYTAETYTTNGMLKKLEESVLYSLAEH